MEITPQPLTREAFAPFGDVIDIPQQAGRTYYEEALGNLRPEARPSLSMSFRPPTAERHRSDPARRVPRGTASSRVTSRLDA